VQIVVDSTVSLAAELLGPLGTLTITPPREITRERLVEADALVVRSTVGVGRELLGGTPVRFVGTATAGSDHVDEAWLRSAGIAFASAAGCNAQAVAEYVVAALLEMAEKQRWGPAGRTLGVVGAGHVGSRVARLGRVLGMKVLVCDPPLARSEAGASGERRFVELGELLAASDVVTLHVPLTDAGPDATRGMVNEQTISLIQNGAILINTARGAVVETPAVVAARRDGRLSGLVLDVWEGEPDLDPALLEQVDIMTPHIAGHSVEGKIAGTRMISDAMAGWMGREAVPVAAGEAAQEMDLAIEDAAGGGGVDCVVRRVVKMVCDVSAVDAELRRVSVGDNTGGRGVGEVARKGYPLRREFASYLVDAESEPLREKPEVVATLRGLGFRVGFRRHSAT